MKDAARDVLVSALGMQDPFSDKNGQQREGPNVSFLRNVSEQEGLTFDAHHVLVNDGTNDRLDSYRQAVAEIRPEMNIVDHFADAPDPTDYGDYFPIMREMVRQVQQSHPPASHRYHILVSPGTGTMQALWVLMVKGGYIDAELWMRRSEGEAERSGKPVVERIGPQLERLPALVRLENELERAEEEVEEEKREAKKRELMRTVYGCRVEWPDLQETIYGVWRRMRRRRPILLFGEAGVGKTHLVRTLSREQFGDSPFERYTPRRPELVDSDLFGHVKGAFTGADKKREGLLSSADGGTLFLDEFADLQEPTQLRLLDVVQGHSFKRVGGSKEIQVELSLVAATNKATSPRELTEECGLRKDLVDRFWAWHRLPPLRDYPPDDLERIVRHAFDRRLERFKTDYELRVCAEVSDQAVVRVVSAAQRNEIPRHFRGLEMLVAEAIDRADEDGARVCDLAHLRRALRDARSFEGRPETSNARFLRDQARDILRW
jgi:sigma54-dependent transcription regulator